MSNQCLLEDLLNMKVESEDKDGKKVEVSPEFRVAVQNIGPNGTHIIIHPNGHNGDTLDFLVNANNLIPLIDG